MKPPTQPPAPDGHTDDRRIAAALWTTVPAALATETGAVGMIVLGAVPGLGIGLVGLLLLQFGLAYRRPSLKSVRRALLVAGPPVRYGLLLLAGWVDLAVRHEALLLAVAGVVGLAVAIPLLSAVLALPGRLKEP
jgi:hypothetical protein